MALLEVNTGNGWYALPTPKPGGYFPSYTHLENSYRDARGYLHRDIIRRSTAKVECSWNALTNDEVRLLQELYGLNSFQLRFTDYYGNRVEKTMYAGPLSAKTERMDTNSYVPNVIVDMSMNFIEY